MKYSLLPTTCVFDAVSKHQSLAFTSSSSSRALSHICPQYVKIMADRGLVRGLMLTQRDAGDCEACHVGKQRRKNFKQKLDREIVDPNQVVYADLLFPGQCNKTQYAAVLVVMDGFSRFITAYLLKSKESAVVNEHMKQYVLWAEQQAGRNVKMVIQCCHSADHGVVKYPVKQVLTDKGGEFVNQEMKLWYATHGIEHIQVGPHSSQLNPCERAHQTLISMTKAMMQQSRLPLPLWTDALRNAVYIKNCVFVKGSELTPYKLMFGCKPDVHHIKNFGALAYMHVSKSTPRQKLHDNAKIGYVLGYAEDAIGCKIYYPQDHVRKFVADVRVNEDVVYKDSSGSACPASTA